MVGSLLAALAPAGRALAQTVAEVREGVLLVTEAVTSAGRDGLRDVAARFPARPSQRRLATQRVDTSPLARTLTLWRNTGRAAGNHGDLYDNRDRGHSKLNPASHPLLSFVEYDEAARAANWDYGLNASLRFDAPTFGNSSTAIVGAGHWRSQARLAMSRPASMARVARLYEANHLYVYPAHRDNGDHHGDVFPANVPYLVCSMGSSGSDRPFLAAIAAIYGAYTPAVKALLVEHGLLAATTQMVLRRDMDGIEDDATYMSGRAHRLGFAGRDIRLEPMVRRANALRPETVPPRLALSLLRAPATLAGADFFQDGVREELFASPGAVGWIARAMLPEWRFELRATPEGPTAGAVRRIHWRVLQGDAARIRIEPLDSAGGRVAVTIPWHDPFPVAWNGDRPTWRVDIGAFADTGAALSAPAFLSLHFPPRQRRSHAADGRLLSVDYRMDGEDTPYADPMLFADADWRDVFQHDPDGTVAGWTRHRGDTTSAFSRDGMLVVSRDALGRPERVRPVSYPILPGRGARRPRIEPEAGPMVWHYRYDGPDDRIGTLDRSGPG